MDVEQLPAVLGQIHVYPYKRADDGSKGFQEHHQGLSKLTLYKEEENVYRIDALRNKDLELLDSFHLTADFRLRYTTAEHFLMFLNKSSNLIYGFGTCKDEPSVEKTQQFAQQLQALIVQLQQERQAQKQSQSRQRSSLQAAASTVTNKQNIDAIQALLPGTILESTEGHDDANSFRSTTTSATFQSPSLSKQFSASTLGSPNPLAAKTHLKIIQTTTVPTTAIDSERIYSANLKRHSSAIATDPKAIPPELVLQSAPQPQLTGTDQHYDSTVAKLGTLDQFPQPTKLSATADHGSDPKVSKPYKVEHTTHMSFGKDGFKGVPQHWIAELNRQFGVPLEQLPSSVVSGYTGKIPYVLQTLRDLLIDKGGLQTVGIFRLAPQAEHFDQAKEDIDSGLLLSKAAKRDDDGKLLFDYEVHVIGNLIKVWLRDLPTPLVNHISRQKVETCSSPQMAWDTVGDLPDPYRSVCQYLIDFCSVVASHHDINKMPPTNLAICFCPNLFKDDPNNPLSTLMFTQKMSKWFTSAIQYRIDNPRTDIETEVEELHSLYSTESAELIPSNALAQTPRHHLAKSRKTSLEIDGIAEDVHVQ